MDKDDDQVLQGEALSDRIKQQMEFPEEAIPLVIFNEEKKSKLRGVVFILTLHFIFSLRAQ